MTRGLSLYLDLVRFSAALIVLVTHLAYRELSGGLLAPWRLVGNDAVMVFFVLSGLVIAHVGATRETGLRDYSLSRLARLWSVAIPALALTVALDFTGRALNPAAYDSWWFAAEDPVRRLLAAITFTNELWFSSWRPFSNGPYWSLGYEFWYYVLFAALTYFRGRTRIGLALLVAAVAGPKIMLLFPIWWMGVWAYRRIGQGAVSAPMGAALFFGSVALYAALRWADGPLFLLALTNVVLGEGFVSEYLRFSNEFLASYLIGPLVVAHFIGAHALAPRLEALLAPAARVIRWVAQSTFALYLLHYPMLRFVGAVVPYERTSPLQIALVLLGVTGAVLLVGPLIERTKGEWRAGLDRLFSMAGRLAPRSRVSPSKPSQPHERA